jgi:two-component system, OmpR family, sensor histidine kinase MprB
MSLRRRMALVIGASVGGAILLAAIISYLAVRSELRGQVDDQLREQVARIAALTSAGPGELPASVLNPPSGSDAAPFALVRVLGAGGDVLTQRGEFQLPAPPPDVPSVDGTFSDEEEGGADFRVITTPLDDGRSVQVFRSLEAVNDSLASLRTVLFLLVMGGAALAALAGRLIADRMLAPIASLTDAAEHVSATEDLSRRIEVTGDDEVAALASRFNTMLERLEASRAALDESHEEQRRLIADASHELRTPVTSLRTNIELIAGGKLDDDEVAGALADAVAQTEELGEVIGDLMDLARGEAQATEFEPVPLDEVAAGAVERARRHAPGVTFRLTAESSVVLGAPDRIARAINNLLDNAAEHADGTPVEVTVAGGAVSVRDHGPGISEADADRLFDRFYRGQEARRRPGSGLGLAIVQQVAEAHEGTVRAENASGGGAVFSLQLPKIDT